MLKTKDDDIIGIYEIWNQERRKIRIGLIAARAYKALNADDKMTVHSYYVSVIVPMAVEHTTIAATLAAIHMLNKFFL